MFTTRAASGRSRQDGGSRRPVALAAPLRAVLDSFVGLGDFCIRLQSAVQAHLLCPFRLFLPFLPCLPFWPARDDMQLISTRNVLEACLCLSPCRGKVDAGAASLVDFGSNKIPEGSASSDLTPCTRPPYFILSHNYPNHNVYPGSTWGTVRTQGGCTEERGWNVPSCHRRKLTVAYRPF